LLLMRPGWHFGGPMGGACPSSRGSAGRSIGSSRGGCPRELPLGHVTSLGVPHTFPSSTIVDFGGLMYLTSFPARTFLDELPGFGSSQPVIFSVPGVDFHQPHWEVPLMDDLL
jgi:hypothetical protein